MPGTTLIADGILRPGLLTGLVVAAPEPWATALTGLGAATVAPPPAAAGDEELAAWAAAVPPVDVVVGGADLAVPVEEALDAVWLRLRAVAMAHWVDRDRDGAVLLVAPGSTPLRAALENLARTLSIEWARYGIRTTTILPGARTTAGEIAATLAFLASPAAAYWSGCVVELGGAAARSQS